MSEDARLIIELEARVDKLAAGLSKANATVYAFARNTDKNLKTANTAWNNLFGSTNPTKAIGNVATALRSDVPCSRPASTAPMRRSQPWSRQIRSSGNIGSG